jgi:hypothetical protein
MASVGTECSEDSSVAADLIRKWRRGSDGAVSLIFPYEISCSTTQYLQA